MIITAIVYMIIIAFFKYVVKPNYEDMGYMVVSFGTFAIFLAIFEMIAYLTLLGVIE